MTGIRDGLSSGAALGEKTRSEIRLGLHKHHTAGLADGNVQGNIVILPAEYAYDFLLYCQRNPKSCPLLAVSDPGNPRLDVLGVDIDIRTDVPQYRVWHGGELVKQPHDISDLWRNDLVTFVIGCSFSFEQALIDAGIRLRHVAENKNVAMYKSNIATQSAGVFSGPLVVSMRPMSAACAIKAIQITSRFPNVHGAPVHIGDPKQIGVNDLQNPDYGDAVALAADEVAVFWACGVTPQAALVAAKPTFCITHAPGAMLITDLTNNQLAA
jgi:uncharacterized protein YcsI (UPF0317 family)